MTEPCDHCGKRTEADPAGYWDEDTRLYRTLCDSCSTRHYLAHKGDTGYWLTQLTMGTEALGLYDD